MYIAIVVVCLGIIALSFIKRTKTKFPFSVYDIKATLDTRMVNEETTQILVKVSSWCESLPYYHSYRNLIERCGADEYILKITALKLGFGEINAKYLDKLLRKKLFALEEIMLKERKLKEKRTIVSDAFELR